MFLTSGFQVGRLDSLTVIGDAQFKGTPRVGDLQGHMLALRVSERVGYRLMSDAIKFFARDGLQGLPSPLGASAQLDRGVLFEFSGRSDKGGQQVSWRWVSAAQVEYPVAAVSEYLVCAVQGLFHLAARGVLVRDSLSHRLEAQHQPLHALQQRVMQFTSNSFALGMTLFQAGT